MACRLICNLYSPALLSRDHPTKTIANWRTCYNVVETMMVADNNRPVEIAPGDMSNSMVENYTGIERSQVDGVKASSYLYYILRE